MAAAQLSKTLWFPSVLAITALITFVTLYNDSQGIGNVTLITNLGCTTASLLTPRGDPLARPGLVQETSANPAAVCQTLPWQPAAYQIPGGGMLKCDNEEHCSFVFRDVCIQRNQSGGGYQEYKWILEVPGGCEIPTPATPPATQACQLENGCGGHRVRIVRPEGGGSVEPGEGGFDPVPTVFLDRSGGQPGNLFHDTSIALYPLFQNMKLRGWRNYAGRRIAITDEYGMPDPAKKGLEELYFAFAPEFTDWRDFTDRKCFKELTLMRTSFKWNCKNYVVTHNPLLNEFADFVGAHFGLPPSRPPLPETPSMFYLHRGGSRKITNWVELMGGLDMPVTIHNTSLSWGEQLAALRKASIVFGLHGAGHTLLPFAPLGAVSIEIFNFGQSDHRLYRNIASASGHYYLKHVIRNVSAIHRKSPYGHPLEHPVTFHYADVELSAQDFHSLVDSAVHILAVQNRKPYYDQRDIVWYPPV